MMEVTHEELLVFVAGKADSETKRRIAAEMKVDGSSTQRWLKRLSQNAADPFQITWGRLVEVDEHLADAEELQKKIAGSEPRKDIAEHKPKFVLSESTANAGYPFRTSRKPIVIPLCWAGTQPATPSAGLASGALGCTDPEAGKHEDDLEQSGTVEEQPDQFTWHEGNSTSVASRTGTIDLGWYANGDLHIRPGGFLRLGRGYTLRAIWTAADGSPRAEPGVLQDKIDLLRLASSDKHGPRDGDLLEIRHTWQPSGSQGWDVSLILELHPTAADPNSVGQASSDIAEREEVGGGGPVSEEPIDEVALSDDDLPFSRLLDCLAVLWAEAAGAHSPLTLAELHSRITGLRGQRGEVLPTLVDVSDDLERAAEMGFLQEVELPPAGAVGGVPFGRGGTGAGRGPQPGYLAAHRPGLGFAPAYQAITASLPPEQRHAALVEAAGTLELPPDLVALLQKRLSGHPGAQP